MVLSWPSCAGFNIKIVTASKTARRKHVPQRTCIGCRSIQAKRSLIRIVRQANGVEIDLTGKLPGRGAYLHDLRSCWEKGLKGALSKALKTNLTPEDEDKLVKYMLSLPDQTAQSTSLIADNSPDITM